MIKVDEHLEVMRQVHREILNSKKRTPHYKDLCRRYNKLKKEYDECLMYMKGNTNAKR